MFFKKIFTSLKQNFLNFIKGISLKRFLSYLGVLIFSALFIWYGSSIKWVPNEGEQGKNNAAIEQEQYKMKVEKTVDEWVVYAVDEETGEQTEEIKERGYVYFAKVLEGDNEGKYTYVAHVIVGLDVVVVKEITPGSTIYSKRIKNVDSLFTNNPDCPYLDNILFTFSAGSPTIDRVPTLIAISIVFVLLLLVLSRVKGIHTLLALGLAAASIFFVYIPAVLSGQNVYLWTIIICLYSVIETLIIYEGITKKTIAAAVGCMSGILVSGLLTIITNASMNILGTSEDIGDSQYWLSYTFYETFAHLKTIDLRGLVFSAVIFGALGAIMDTAMSLASSLLEVYENSVDHSLVKTMKSGLNIGRDMIATMSNTLVLAYLSTSLTTTLYYISHYYPEAIFRKEFFALAVSQAIIGCIGIIITIPLTSLVCGLLYNKKGEWFPKKKTNELVNE